MPGLNPTASDKVLFMWFHKLLQPDWYDNYGNKSNTSCKQPILITHLIPQYKYWFFLRKSANIFMYILYTFIVQ
jgi:hypothetical protein